MADLLPSTPDPSAGDGGEPRVIGVDSEDADDLLAALQSETARDVLGVLYDEPATPSSIAESVDTSIQNARYHLDRLADAELVEVADTIYSEKGREMKVYAPAAKPLVVFAGNDEDAPGLEAALSSLLGGLGILGLSSLAVQRIFGGPYGVGGSIDTAVSWQGGDAAESTTESADAGAVNQSVTVTESDGAGPNDDSATTTEEAATKTEEAATKTEEAATTVEETATTAEEAGTTAQDEETTAEQATEATQTAEETTEATRTAQETMEETTQTVEEAAETTRTVAETTQAAADSATTVTEEAARATTTVTDAAGSAMSGLPPGLLFFAGGLAVLLALGVALHLRAR